MNQWLLITCRCFCFVFVFAFAFVGDAYAEFSLNFQAFDPDRSKITPYANCMSDCTGSAINRGMTKFLTMSGVQDWQGPEYVFLDTEGNAYAYGNVPSGVEGTYYQHMIVGDPMDGMIQEVYVATTSDNMHRSGTLTGGVDPCPNRESSCGKITKSIPEDWGQHVEMLGPADRSGNGVVNVEKVLVYQIVSDGQMHSEFKKDKFGKKPLITQFINAPGINSFVSIDMRNSSYDDASTPGVMMNIMSVYSADGWKVEFNNGKDIQKSTLDAGLYTFDKTATDANGVGSKYDYVNGDYDHTSIEWSSYYEDLDSNIWAYDIYKPQ